MAHQNDYDRFDYNVRLGIAVDPGPDFPDYVRKAAIATRSLRIDAVGWQGDQPTIFEVKRRAGLENVGQLFGYFHMWKAQQLSLKDPLLVLVCADFSSHILPATQASGIRIDVVPTDFSFLSPHAAIAPGAPTGTPAQRLEADRATFPAMQVDEILVWRNWLRS